MHFNILTLFPQFFKVPFGTGILGRAIKKNLISTSVVDIRKFTADLYQTVDDRPFGGGDGMVLSYKPLSKAIDSLKNRGHVILLSPQGEKWDHKSARKQAKEQRDITLVCGRYSGIDARWISQYVNQEISIGDYIVSGGEIGALTLIDSISRYIEGVLGHPQSAYLESFETGLLEHPQWTRPKDISGYKIPDVFFSGDHKKIEKARYYLSLIKTAQCRPDLLHKEKYSTDLKQAIQWLQSLTKEEQKTCGFNKDDYSIKDFCAKSSFS